MEGMEDSESESVDLNQHQQKFFDIGTFDKRKVDLNKPAMTPKEFLRQVIVERERTKEIALASNYKELMRNGASTSNKIRSLVQPDEHNFPSRFGPSKEWCLAKSNEFSHNRSLIESKKAPTLYLKGLSFPAMGDSMGWRQICLERRLEGFKIEPEFEERFAHHKGTPPTLGLLKSLSDSKVNTILVHLIECVIENGYTRPSLQWLYALFLVLKKPLLGDVCALLRDFCRKCREWRAQLDEDELDEIYELSWFIAIISIYFAQRDLAD